MKMLCKGAVLNASPLHFFQKEAFYLIAEDNGEI